MYLPRFFTEKFQASCFVPVEPQLEVAFTLQPNVLVVNNLGGGGGVGATQHAKPAALLRGDGAMKSTVTPPSRAHPTPSPAERARRSPARAP